MPTLSIMQLITPGTQPGTQQPPTAENAIPFFIWGGIAILAAFALVVAVVAIRKKFFPKEEPSAAPAGFGVSELKDLHAQGLLTDEEFAIAKAKIVAQSHAVFMAPKNKTGGKLK